MVEKAAITKISNMKIPLLHKEEVSIYEIKRRPDKIEQLHRRGSTIPKEETEYFQRRIDSVQKLIRSASKELDDIKNEIVASPKKNPVEIDTIVIDIRKRLNKTNELIKNCDPRFIENISEIDTLIDRHTDLEHVAGYYELILDSKKAKKDFIDNCPCKPKIKK